MAERVGVKLAIFDPTTGMPSAFPFLKFLAPASLVSHDIDFIALRSMSILNRFCHRRARERMSPLEMSGNAVLDRFHDVSPRPRVLRKRAFYQLLNDDHLRLCRDQIGITRRRLPIDRAEFLRRHTPAVAGHLPARG